MSATFDTTTKAAYDAATTAAARAAAIVASLSVGGSPQGSVVVKVYSGASPDVEMGSGTMSAPWATASGGTVVIGEVSSFTVGTTGTPNANWYIKFQTEDGTRWAKGSFGLSSSSQDFKWSLANWTSGQTGTIGTATIVCGGNAVPVFTVAPSSASIAATGGTIQFTATDPDGGTILYSLTTTRSGITINSTTGLVTVTAAAAGTSGNIVVQASDGILTASTSCAVTVASLSGAELKFNPGHYVQITTWSTPWVNQGDRFAHYDTLAAEPNIKGVVLFDRDWGLWEGNTPGDYSAGFSRMDAEIAKLKSVGLRVFLRLWPWRNTGLTSSTPPSGFVPTYLQTSTYGGGAIRNASAWIYTANWNTPCMDRYIALMDAYGSRYDSDPYVEGIMAGIESSLPWSPSYPAPSGYSEDINADSYVRLITALRGAWPTSQVQTSVSWMNKVPEYVALLSTLRATGGSEDLLPTGLYPGITSPVNNGSWATREYQGLSWTGGGTSSTLTDRRGVTAHCDMNQSPVYGPKEGCWLPSEVFAMANTLRQTYMMWVEMYDLGATQPSYYNRSDMGWEEYRQRVRWLGSYGGSAVGILPFIRTNPAWTQMTAPTSLLPVNTGGT